MNLVKCDTLILFFGLEFIFHEQFSVTGGDFNAVMFLETRWR